MLTYKNGQTVRTGTYWDVVSGRRIEVSGEAVLAGTRASTYLKASTGLMLLTAPVAGLLYVVLMPFLGMTAIASIVGVSILNSLSELVGKSISFGWRPKSAYLSGKKKRKEQ